MTTTTRDASVEMQLDGGTIRLRFCDANVAQWDEDLGSMEDYHSHLELVAVVSSVIAEAADDLAETLVGDLLTRTAVKAGT